MISGPHKLHESMYSPENIAENMSNFVVIIVTADDLASLVPGHLQLRRCLDSGHLYMGDRHFNGCIAYCWWNIVGNDPDFSL